MVMKDGAAKDSSQANAMCNSMFDDHEKRMKEEAAHKWRYNIHENTMPLSEASIVPDKDGKKSFRAWWPLLKVGPGNTKDRNFYTQKAVESAAPLALSRRKMFFNHTDSAGKPKDRSVQDWAASIHETKVEDGTLFGLVQAYDPWLKDRMYDAPGELCASIEGRGKTGGTKDVDGVKFNLVEEVKWINAFTIVDYAGNAPMGVSIVEGSEGDPEEEIIVDAKELKEKHPEIYSEVENIGRAAAKDDHDKIVTAKDAEIKALKEGKTVEEKDFAKLNEKLAAQDAEILKLKNTVDAQATLTVEKEKKAEIAKLVESLPKEAITPVFKELVESAKDVETAKKLVEDRAALFSGKVIGHGKTDDKTTPDEAKKLREKETAEAFGFKVEDDKK